MKFKYSRTGKKKLNNAFFFKTQLFSRLMLNWKYEKLMARVIHQVVRHLVFNILTNKFNKLHNHSRCLSIDK